MGESSAGKCLVFVVPRIPKHGDQSGGLDWIYLDLCMRTHLCFRCLPSVGLCRLLLIFFVQSRADCDIHSSDWN